MIGVHLRSSGFSLEELGSRTQPDRLVSGRRAIRPLLWLGYALAQIFWAHSDTEAAQFNYSEIIGTFATVAISNSYYRDNCNVSDAVSKLGMQLGMDIAANILKKFWRDLRRTFRHMHRKDANAIT